jgi:hypothetical protein
MVQPTPRYLTKSRFRLGMQCPAKLYYAGKDTGANPLYANERLEDEFLAALAEGGFQVGELARQYFPDGHLVEALDHEVALAKTRELLQLENVVIFEAAFRHDGLFIRVDVLVKQGARVDLIEVKAKSFDPRDDRRFGGKAGRISSQWRPYLQDVAFQKHVMTRAFPGWMVRAFLMLPDKSSQCPSDGLHQKFRVQPAGKGTRRTPRFVTQALTPEERARRILCQVNVDTECSTVYSTLLEAAEGPAGFADRVNWLQEHHAADRRIECAPSAACAGCEFKATVEEKARGLRSGFEECWQRALHWGEADFAQPSVLALWNSRRKERFMAEGKYKLTDLTTEDIQPKADTKPGISPSQRQWLQIRKAQQADATTWIDREGLQREMERWRFPLHFIDFETTRVAIPFHRGLAPYALVAFQFSHHRVQEDGSIEHANDYLHGQCGAFPNFEFAQRLREALAEDQGTILCYANHENSTLAEIDTQLGAADLPASERGALRDFIRSITVSPAKSREKWRGPRAMVDLCDLVKRHYYAPGTNGSNSIKEVLPAVLEESAFLQRKYASPIYGRGCRIPSRNFEAISWIRREGGRIKDPYHLLPRVCSDISNQDQERLLAQETLREGGAAMIAYARMQFEEMPETERAEIRAALLRYCELDTFAMVMLYEAWRDECGHGKP